MHRKDKKATIVIYYQKTDKQYMSGFFIRYVYFDYPRVQRVKMAESLWNLK